MTHAWSNPVPYDLRRSARRTSVPKEFETLVPESSGAYVIYRMGDGLIGDLILDIGETGQRPRSTPHGLRGRLATTVPHSASERIALDIARGKIRYSLWVIWFETESKSSARSLQDALITLFREEYGRQPEYNTKAEVHHQPHMYIKVFSALKRKVGSANCYAASPNRAE
jgi:hypothetical protein